MDYFKQSRVFQCRKVLRYITIYGFRRTYIKVRGQLHTRSRNPHVAFPGRASGKHTVALIGCGNYGFSNIAYYLTRRYGSVIRACMDIDPCRAASLSRYYKVPLATTDADEIYNDDAITLLYIASNHASHAEYAIRALQSGKHVYIEKPHVVSADQLQRLAQAMEKYGGKVFLGFNRPNSRFGRLIRRYLDRESGAGIYNWFIAGHQIDPDHWYFAPEEGGRVLGNLCHWTDFVLRLVPDDLRYPILINPTKAATSDSDIAVTYTFGDGTIAVISFSAKGHSFEGVRERFSAHKGDCLVWMQDFRTLVIESGHIKKRYVNLYRDQGHRENILSAYESVRINSREYNHAHQLAYISNTACLFLKTKEALESGREVTVNPFGRVEISPQARELTGTLS